MILGVDVGGVIIDKDRNDNSDTSLFGDNYLRAKAVDFALAALRDLEGGAFSRRLWIVSKCGDRIERRTREWMNHNGFHDMTGIPKERLRFCRERSEKAAIARDLGLTHFVDDKLEVLHHLGGIVPNRVLFRPYLSEVKRWRDSLDEVYIADDWQSLAIWLEGTAANG